MSDTSKTDLEFGLEAADDSAAVAFARELERENAKLRFLISEVVETQPVSDACRDDLRAALKT